MRSNSTIPNLEYEDIISGIGLLNKDLNSKPTQKNGIKFFPDDILFGKLRPYLENWFLAHFTGVAVGDFWVLQPIEVNSKFLYYLIQTNNFKSIANQSTGTKMPRSDWNLVSKTEFHIPIDSNEQSLIGGTLENLDLIITLHQRKLEKLQNLKKAYQEEMFV